MFFMIETYSEVTEFFKRKEFSQLDLDNLRENLIANYGSKNAVINSINSSINLHLIHYQISGPIKEIITNNKSIKPGKKKKKNKKKQIELKFKRMLKKKHEALSRPKYSEKGKKMLQNLHKFTVGKPIEKAAIYIGFSYKLFLNKLILPEDYNRWEIELFDEKIWELNKGWIEKQLIKDYKSQLSRSSRITVKKTNQIKSKSSGRYSEIEKSKRIKIIYTRM
jgi:hypothetical protein